mgnify:CR=1 FL=1
MDRVAARAAGVCRIRVGQDPCHPKSMADDHQHGRGRVKVEFPIWRLRPSSPSIRKGWLLSERRQPISVGLDQVVAEASYLIQGEFARGVGVEHGGVIDVFAFAGEGSFDCEELGVDVCTVEGGELFGQLADVSWLNTIAINKGRNFDACLRRQVGDQAVV